MKLICRLLILLVITFTLIDSMAATATLSKNENSSRLWNLQDADILSVINEVSLETGKNFVVDPRINGKITLVSSKPINSSQVYNLFLSILELLGYSAIQNGDVVKIIPNMEVGERAGKVANKYSPGHGDEVVVRIFPLENVTASQLIPVIQPFLPQWSHVSAYTPGNVLIIFGRAANLSRISKIIHDIDTQSNNEIDVIPLHQTAAVQLATVLTNLQSAARATGEMPQVSIAPDERSNSILLSGNHRARLKMHALVNQLDTPGAGTEGNTEVIYLKYLKAKDFAPILNKIAQNISARDKDKDIANAATYSGTNKPETSQNVSNILAEPNTNAIIITAPTRLIRTLHGIVSKLDIRPAQVHIEAILVELNEADLKNLGIQWGSITTDGTFLKAYAQSGLMPLGLGNIGIMPSQQITAVLGILQNMSGADILSTPSLVVLDNQKASLSVGTQVSDTTGSFATNSNVSTTPFNTYNRLNVVLKLEVTPQINLSNLVRLTIALKNDSLKDPENPGLTPIVNTSEIKNSVIIKSEDILVLGGLMSNNIKNVTEKIPFLGDIPLLGLLFQHHSSHLQKKNLMIFIKPTILHTEEDSVCLTHMKYNTIRQAQINWPEDLSSEGKQKLQNILPPIGNTVDLPKPFQ